MEPDKYPAKTLPGSTPEEPGVRLFRALGCSVLFRAVRAVPDLSPEPRSSDFSPLWII